MFKKAVLTGISIVILGMGGLIAYANMESSTDPQVVNAERKEKYQKPVSVVDPLKKEEQKQIPDWVKDLDASEKAQYEEIKDEKGPFVRGDIKENTKNKIAELHQMMNEEVSLQEFQRNQVHEMESYAGLFGLVSFVFPNEEMKQNVALMRDLTNRARYYDSEKAVSYLHDLMHHMDKEMNNKSFDENIHMTSRDEIFEYVKENSNRKEFYEAIEKEGVQYWAY